MSDLDDADRPATFREVLANGEFRALYVASVLSWFGDYLAKAAVTALVYQQTKSVAASAAAFAISFLPWLGLGPILSALAERLPYRRTMVVTDLLRMVLIALVALPGMDWLPMIGLLFLTAVCNPPFDAARSALLSKVLDGDRYVVGLTLQNTSVQVAQIAGYISGATLATLHPQRALLFNAVTFGFSAIMIGLWVKPRPPALAAEDRSDLLRETASGMKLVFGTPILRAVALIVLGCSLFAVVPEGLAAAWAASLSDDPETRGWVQGIIMIANPIGFVVGGLIVGRLISPSKRERVIPVFAIAVPAALAPAIIYPSAVVVYVISFLCGAATAGLLPPTNALFVQALPDTHRARAFGVMKSGIQVIQGVAVFVTGGLADRFDLPLVVGLWGLAGVALMTAVVVTWPGRDTIAAEVTRVKELNSARATRLRESAPTVELRKPSPRRRPFGTPETGVPAPGNPAPGHPTPSQPVAGHPSGNYPPPPIPPGYPAQPGYPTPTAHPGQPPPPPVAGPVAYPAPPTPLDPSAPPGPPGYPAPPGNAAPPGPVPGQSAPPNSPAPRPERPRPGRHRAEDRGAGSPDEGTDDRPENGTAPGLPSRAGTMER